MLMFPGGEWGTVRESLEEAWAWRDVDYGVRVRHRGWTSEEEAVVFRWEEIEGRRVFSLQRYRSGQPVGKVQTCDGCRRSWVVYHPTFAQVRKQAGGSRDTEGRTGKCYN